MRKNIGYWILAGLLLMLCASTATANDNCSIWWDDLICGDGPIDFEGLVLYQFEILESPISVASSDGWHPGTLSSDQTSLAFTQEHGNMEIAEYDAETGCYLNWNGEMPSVIVALCYDSDAGMINLWYGTLEWTGFGGELTGPWMYHMPIQMIAVEAVENNHLRRQLRNRVITRPSDRRAPVRR
jgi:hypothetical protein